MDRRWCVMAVVPLLLSGCSAVRVVEQAAGREATPAATTTPTPAVTAGTQSPGVTGDPASGGTAGRTSPPAVTGTTSPATTPTPAVSTPDSPRTTLAEFTAQPGVPYDGKDFRDAVQRASTGPSGFRFVGDWAETKDKYGSRMTYSVESLGGPARADLTDAATENGRPVPGRTTRVVDVSDGWFYSTTPQKPHEWSRQKRMDADEDRRYMMTDLDDVISWTIAQSPGTVTYLGENTDATGAPVYDFRYVFTDSAAMEASVRVDGELRLREYTSRDQGVQTLHALVDDYGKVSPISAPPAREVVRTLPKSTPAATTS